MEKAQEKVEELREKMGEGGAGGDDDDDDDDGGGDDEPPEPDAPTVTQTDEL